MTEYAASCLTENVLLASVTSFTLHHDEVLSQILLPLLSPESVWSSALTQRPTCLPPVYSPVLGEPGLFITIIIVVIIIISFHRLGQGLSHDPPAPYPLYKGLSWKFESSVCLFPDLGCVSHVAGKCRCYSTTKHHG